jgi:UbiD family decarboxylase
MDQSLRPLIAALDAKGRLARVTRPIDPERDLAAVALKIHHARGNAAHFQTLEHAPGWQAAGQLLLDRAHWALGLGIGEAELLTTIRDRMRGMIRPNEAPRDLRSVGLDTLPIPRAGDRDSAAQFVAIAIAVDPVDGREVLGLTRHHVIGTDHVSVLNLCPALERVRRHCREAGETMRMALVNGADPALILAAALGTWRHADLALAGSLAGAPIRIARQDGIPVPVDAELVIAGQISGTETAVALEFCSPFGTYAETVSFPVLSVASVQHREEPIFHALHVGGPGDMAGALCLAAEALVADHIRNIEGGIDFLDIRCPPAAGGQVVIVKLRGRVEGQTKTALMGALSGPANWFKLAIAIDEDVDAGDLRDVFWSMASRTHAEKDVGMIDGMRAHPLDLASPLVDGGRVGTRWFFDSSMPPLTQGKRRDDFIRAIPKNLGTTDLTAFLPKL